MTAATATTTREDFDALTADHRVIPVIRELFADGETPVGDLPQARRAAARAASCWSRPSRAASGRATPSSG